MRSALADCHPGHGEENASRDGPSHRALFLNNHRGRETQAGSVRVLSGLRPMLGTV